MHESGILWFWSWSVDDHRWLHHNLTVSKIIFAFFLFVSHNVFIFFFFFHDLFDLFDLFKFFLTFRIEKKVSYWLWNILSFIYIFFVFLRPVGSLFILFFSFFFMKVREISMLCFFQFSWTTGSTLVFEMFIFCFTWLF